MIKVTIKYFASLREIMHCSEREMNVEQNIKIGDLWQTLANTNHVDITNILMAVNMTYVKPEHILNEGDEVAFFPPVTGG